MAENFDNIRPEPLSANLAGFYKLRVGDYRVVYEVFDTERCLIIHKIGHRREVYR
ncbi:type II toxin-antitoxin system RelE family toxin [Candidatus Venteria ishoeyi]|uniref:type II toxin-antitoxin system RelE family toxin n=1 Tax=Candidatus Venteria ishoeyi TaxID=1899563 RepID=UPI00387E6C13